MTDLEAPITNSSGRKARPIRRAEVNPQRSEAEVEDPPAKATDFSARSLHWNRSEDRFQYVALDVAFDAESLPV